MLNLGSIFIDTIKIISMNYAKIIYVPIFIVFWNGNTVFTISTALYHFNLLSSIYCIVYLIYRNVRTKDICCLRMSIQKTYQDRL